MSRVLLNGVERGEFAAAQVHPEEAREMIYAGAENGARPVRIRGEDPLKVYRFFIGITHITRVSEGR